MNHVMKLMTEKRIIKMTKKEVKDEYKDATHYCYAYIIDDIKKSSDDGEPVVLQEFLLWIL